MKRREYGLKNVTKYIWIQKKKEEKKTICIKIKSRVWRLQLTYRHYLRGRRRFARACLYNPALTVTWVESTAPWVVWLLVDRVMVLQLLQSNIMHVLRVFFRTSENKKSQLRQTPAIIHLFQTIAYIFKNVYHVILKKIVHFDDNSELKIIENLIKNKHGWIPLRKSAFNYEQISELLV